MLTPPPAAVVPNAWARRRGLTLAATFGGVTARPGFITNGAVEAAFSGGSAPGLSGGVVGMVGTAGYWQATSGTPTYNLPTGRGTVVIVARSAAASGSGARRYLASIGYLSGFPASPFFGATDFDDNLTVGWANSGTDGRISVSSAGGALWAAGATIVITLSYGAGGQTLYVNGIQKGTQGFASYGNTSGGIFAVGQLDGFGAPWLTAAGDAIYSLLAFDTELTPGEVARISDDPWMWSRSLLRRRSSVAPVTSTIAGTISVTGSLTGVSGVLGTIAGTIPVTGSIIAGGLHGVVRRRGRYRVYRDVPAELAPAVDLAAGFAEAEVSRVVEEAMRRYRALSLKTSVARRTALVQELNTQIVAAVARAAEADDEEALAALL